jgi:hypothetical protein
MNPAAKAGFFYGPPLTPLRVLFRPEFLIRLKDQNVQFAVKSILAETNILWAARRRS